MAFPETLMAPPGHDTRMQPTTTSLLSPAARLIGNGLVGLLAQSVTVAGAPLNVTVRFVTRSGEVPLFFKVTVIEIGTSVLPAGNVMWLSFCEITTLLLTAKLLPSTSNAECTRFVKQSRLMLSTRTTLVSLTVVPVPPGLEQLAVTMLVVFAQ